MRGGYDFSREIVDHGPPDEQHQDDNDNDHDDADDDQCVLKITYLIVNVIFQLLQVE